MKGWVGLVNTIPYKPPILKPLLPYFTLPSPLFSFFFSYIPFLAHLCFCLAGLNVMREKKNFKRKVMKGIKKRFDRDEFTGLGIRFYEIERRVFIET